MIRALFGFWKKISSFTKSASSSLPGSDETRELNLSASNKDELRPELWALGISRQRTNST